MRLKMQHSPRQQEHKYLGILIDYELHGSISIEHGDILKDTGCVVLTFIVR